MPAAGGPRQHVVVDRKPARAWNLNTRSSGPATRTAHYLVGLIATLGTLNGFADTLRVTTWDLQSSNSVAVGSTNTAVRQWAATLAKLNPDVILLQGVTDWQTCAQLVAALKPAEFHIAICSSFRPPQRAPAGGNQVAILTKRKAYFSWSAAWEEAGETGTPGGFAFAALETGKARVGFFCAEFGAAPVPDAQVRPLLEQLDAVKRWEANQVQSFVVAAAFGDASKNAAAAVKETVRFLEGAGFVDALRQLPATQRITVAPKPGRPGTAADFLLVEPSVFPTPQILTVPDSERYPVICDLELDAAKAAVACTEKARQAELLSQAQAAALPEKPATLPMAGSASPRFLLPAAVGSLALALLALVVALTRNRKRVPSAQALLPEHSGSPVPGAASYTVVIAPASVTGSLTEPPPRNPMPQPVVHLESVGTQTHSTEWRERALEAEAKAERAQAALRRGVLPHLRRWLRQRLVSKLVTDRTRLLEAQQAATRKALSVDERLSRIEVQLQQQNRAYERRIEELTCELVAAKEENRELIRARIAQVKLEMEAARSRLLAEAENNQPGV